MKRIIKKTTKKATSKQAVKKAGPDKVKAFSKAAAKRLKDADAAVVQPKISKKNGAKPNPEGGFSELADFISQQPRTVITEIDSSQELVLAAIRECCGTNLDQPISFGDIARKANAATDKAHNDGVKGPPDTREKRKPNYNLSKRVKTIRRVGRELVEQGILIEGDKETFQLANVTIQTPMEGQPTGEQPAMVPVATRVVGKPKASGGKGSNGRGSSYSGKTIYFHATKPGAKPANKSREGSLLHSSFEDLQPGIAFDQWRAMNSSVKTQYGQRRLYLANWIKAGICFIR